MTTIGPCGYAEPHDGGDLVCRKSGKCLVVRDVFGHLSWITRCRHHSDWMGVEEEKTMERLAEETPRP